MAPRKGKWSEWMWSGEYKRDYRYREVTDSKGKTEYEYQYKPDAEAPAQADNYTFSDPVEKVTGQLAQTNLSHAGSSNIITGSSNTDALDPNFKIYSSSHFKQWRVLKIVWSEPRGNAGTVITNVSESKHGQQSYSTVRRFVIVKSNKGHSLCLPILTYSNRGLLKNGAKPEHHCIVYTSKSPQSFEGEATLNRPLRMIPSNSREKLDMASRMNYAKVYTVEHNVKVHFIGHISPKDEHILAADFNRINMLQGPDRPRTSDSYGTSYPSTQASYAPTYTPTYAPSYAPYAPGTSQSYAPPQTYPAHSGPETGGQSHQYDRTLYEGD